MADPKTRLLAERERTVAELQRLLKYLGTDVDRFSAGGKDSVDAASDLHEREKSLGLVRLLERKLVAVERASQALEHGGYGICEICREAINPERMAAIAAPYLEQTHHMKARSYRMIAPAIALRRLEWES